MSAGDLLRHAADLLDVDAAEVPDEVKRDRVLALVAVSGLVDAELTVSVGVFDANTVWAGDGARSIGGWLAARTGLTQRGGAAVGHRARSLRDCPQVVAMGDRSGRLGTAVVQALMAARAVYPGWFDAGIDDLLVLLDPLTTDQAITIIATWRAYAIERKAYDDAQAGSDEAPDEPPADPAADNSLHLSRTLDGRYLGAMDYDPVTGAEIETAITAEVDELFRLGTFGSDDGITPSRRRSIAHRQLVLRGALPGATKHGDPRPSVAVSIDSRTLAGEPVDGLEDLMSRECGLDDGTPVDRRSIERLLCTARIQAFLIRIGDDGAIETLGITDLLRDATRRQRRALKKRDKGCVFTGCSAPPDRCQAHHLVFWEHDGPTLLANLTSSKYVLCRQRPRSGDRGRGRQSY